MGTRPSRRETNSVVKAVAIFANVITIENSPTPIDKSATIEVVKMPRQSLTKPTEQPKQIQHRTNMPRRRERPAASCPCAVALDIGITKVGAVTFNYTSIPMERVLAITVQRTVTPLVAIDIDETIALLELTGA